MELKLPGMFLGSTALAAAGLVAFEAPTFVVTHFAGRTYARDELVLVLLQVAVRCSVGDLTTAFVASAFSRS